MLTCKHSHTHILMPLHLYLYPPHTHTKYRHNPYVPTVLYLQLHFITRETAVNVFTTLMRVLFERICVCVLEKYCSISFIIGSHLILRCRCCVHP